jgi:hypothetical protein
MVKKPPSAQLAIEDEAYQPPPAGAEGVYVLCSAGDVRQAYFATRDGAREVDVALAIRAFRCEPDEPSREQPEWLNSAVQHARSEFSTAIDRLQTTPAVTRPGAQKWVLKQLANLGRATEDDTERHQLGSLHRAFSRPLNHTVIHMLRRLQREDITGPDFISQLDEIASAYGLYAEADAPERKSVTQADIRLVCSQVQLTPADKS